MKTLQTVCVVLLFSLLWAVPALAYTPKAFPAVAWADGDTIYVAIANEDSGRGSYTIELLEKNRNNRLERRIVVIPSQTVLIEAFSLRKSLAESVEEIRISHRLDKESIPVQHPGPIYVPEYVVRHNTHIQANVNLTELIDGGKYDTLTIDDRYSFFGNGRDGDISVNRFSGGFNRTPGRNKFTYEPPYLELSMRTPNIRATGILTFGLTRELARPGRDYREYIQGPSILVYGRDMRLIDNTSGTSSRRGTK